MATRTWTDSLFIKAVAENISVSGVIRALGLHVRPGNFTTVYRHIKRLGLDSTHFKGQAHGTSKTGSGKKEIEEWTVLGSNPASTFKKRLLLEGLLKNCCYICGLGPEWQGSPLSLQLDHINGNNTDNRIENLRILCPNCHTQTETFSTRRLRKDRLCPCGKKISRVAVHCKACSTKEQSIHYGKGPYTEKGKSKKAKKESMAL